MSDEEVRIKAHKLPDSDSYTITLTGLTHEEMSHTMQLLEFESVAIFGVSPQNDDIYLKVDGKPVVFDE